MRLAMQTILFKCLVLFLATQLRRKALGTHPTKFWIGDLDNYLMFGDLDIRHTELGRNRHYSFILAFRPYVYVIPTTSAESILCSSTEGILKGH